MSTVQWRGSKNLRELPESGIEETLEKNSKELEYEGPYTECLAKRPKPGSLEVKTGYVITRVRVRRLPGGRGRLTLTLDRQLAMSTSPPPAGQTVELDWIETEKDLLLHPRYSMDTDPIGARALDPGDLCALKNWEDEPNAEIKSAFKYRLDPSRPAATAEDLSYNAKDYATKRLRGQSTYRVYLPVVKRTTRISNPIKGDPCGKKLSNLPSGLPQPDGYQWLKTADRSTRSGSGKWERHEEWGGFSSVDGDIY
ncbi:MAG: hypothetical protein NTY53_05070 [Kiritimatiellaeota bacterium]|nr:hypothetical protein [Kiritimatiellota bacterium]